MLHLLLAFFLPNWIRTQSQGLQPIESLTFAHLIRLQIQQPVERAPAHALPQAAKLAKIVSYAKVRTQIAARTKKPAVPQHEVLAPGTHAAAPKRRVHQAAPLYAQITTPQKPIAAAEQNAPASPQPAVVGGSRSVAGGNGDRGGVMPLGAQQDPVLDPRVVAMLQQKVGSQHVTLSVTVGEDGRTMNVSFDPPLDAQTEHEIEAILAEADWDAAVCGGGVSCQGVATIRL